MKFLNRNIIICIGQTGMGKTVWSKGYLRTQKRVVIIDPQDEYSYLYFHTASNLISYISDKNIFRVKCVDLREFSDICFGVILIPNTLLVIEESQRILAPRLKIPREFEDIIYRGRHSGTSVLLIAQRAKTIDIAIRSQFTELIVFKQSETGDLKWIEDVTGYDIGEKIRNLKVLEYYHISNIGYEKKILNKFY